MELPFRKSKSFTQYRQQRPITKVKVLKHTKPVEESSAKYQQEYWEKLKKHFRFLVSIIDAENFLRIKKRIMNFNIVRGRGLLCSSILWAQLFHVHKTDLYAVIASLINYNFPNLGELLLVRCVWQLKSGYRQNCITVYSSSAIFIAHLIYRGVAHVSLGIDVLKLLFKYPTDEDLIRTAIIFYTICGKKMIKNCEKGELNNILRTVHHLSLDNEFSRQAQEIIERNLLKPKKYNLPILRKAQNFNVVHDLYFDGIEDPLDCFDHFEVDMDFISNNAFYQLQIQQLKDEIDYGRVNDSDDADDEEEDLVMN